MTNSSAIAPASFWDKAQAALVGLFLGICLLKLGNPVNLADQISQPTSWEEAVGLGWPLAWGYFALGLVALAGVVKAIAGHVRLPQWHWALWLPLIWLGWQYLSSANSINPTLSSVLLKHFLACLICFFIGWLTLGGGRQPLYPYVLAGVLLGFLGMERAGWDQHFGGLEETRRYFRLYIQPTLKEVSPDYLKKIESNRIFGTLFYPNALAGAILLLLPPLLVQVWQWGRRLSIWSRMVVSGVFAGSALACLFWSGSKAGWLLLLVMGVVALLHFPMAPKLRRGLVVGILVVGLAAFFVKFSGFFARGAPSVSARLVYWQAAWRTFSEHAILGTGPGTFSEAYQKIKPPGAEMARLAHNDYLQQFSDGGLVSGLAYTGFVAVSLWVLYRRVRLSGDPVKLGLWLGLLGISLQECVEFSLYIPALAWPTWCFFGWLWAQAGETAPRTGAPAGVSAVTTRAKARARATAARGGNEKL